MRLLHVETLTFREFRDENRPKYVIASHRWVEGSEVILQDVQNGWNKDKDGYKKIVDFAKYAQDEVSTLKWMWMDTCCINKDSTAELSGAINLMFDWYRDAELCIAYLADVKTADDKSSFRESEWFRRGWTLQELLAPPVVVFVTKQWLVIGNKGASTHSGRGTYAGPSLEKDIAGITDIPEQTLHDYSTCLSLSVEEKLQWMDGRTTTREEDMSYSLYGIFGVTPGANYGERRDRAHRRLMTAIQHEGDVAAQRADRFQRIAGWLSAPDPWTNHQTARQLREPQSGSWLIQSDQYQDWKSGLTRHLWMYGKAGCGKTVLCSKVIDDAKAHCEDQLRVGYAAFYFTFSDNQKQLPLDLLRSLVVQLGWKGPALSMLQQAYDKPKRSLLGLDELEIILLSCFESYDEVFLLIDALDECPEDSDARCHMLECLTRLSQKAHHVRIFETSRELPDIRESMVRLGAELMSIGTGSADVDIRQYVAAELTRDYRLSRLDPKTKVLIEETISDKADGMFRWACCQLEELKKLKSTRPKFVEYALYSLPTTLDGTYERMLIGIEDELRTDALTLLRWLVYAKSPPSLGELVDATIIDLTAEGAVEEENRPGIGDTLEILSELVIVVPSRRQKIGRDTKVRLAHFSVKEYLESKRILEGSAKYFHLESAREHRVLSQSCLVYLMHYSSCDEKLSAKQDLTEYPLLRYAAQSWFYHSLRQQPGEVTCETRLLYTKEYLHDWLLVHQPDQLREAPFEPMKNAGSGLYYASYTCLEAVVNELLGAKADVNAQGGIYGNALQAASFKGHEKLVQILIDAGADVNAQGEIYGNALRAALARGHEKVVQVLMDAGADSNARGGIYGNTLQAASFDSYEKLVQILIDAGADVNARGGHYGYARQTALAIGHEKVVRVLIDVEADVNVRGGRYGNALQAASDRGHEKVVQRLIGAGVDVNARGGRYGNSNALQAASAGGHEKVVQILIDAGADVNAQGERYGNSNALQAASAGGHDEVVQMLIDAGVDVNARGGRYGNSNALQAASAGGHDEVVQMLIDAGADVNAQGEAFGYALQVALVKGHKKVVQVLLENGANTEW